MRSSPSIGAELLSQRSVAKDVEARYTPDALEGLDDADLTTELVAHDDLSGSTEENLRLSFDSILDEAPKLKTELFGSELDNHPAGDFDDRPSLNFKGIRSKLSKREGNSFLHRRP